MKAFLNSTLLVSMVAAFCMANVRTAFADTSISGFMAEATQIGHKSIAITDKIDMIEAFFARISRQDSVWADGGDDAFRNSLSTHFDENCVGIFPANHRCGTATTAQEQTEAWRDLLARCTEPYAYQRSNGGRHLGASQAQLLLYLKQVEAANPSAAWQKILAALHGHFYLVDLNRTLPIVPVPLFVHGPQTAGWESVDLVCNIRDRRKPTPFPPHMVTLENGELVDIAHVYAGPRSDLGRETDFEIWRTLMAGANTYIGDVWQYYFEGAHKAPRDQMIGDVMSLWLTGFYRIPQNRSVPLSQAMEQLFAAIKVEPGGRIDKLVSPYN